jgi:hypothetical protein
VLGVDLGAALGLQTSPVLLLLEVSVGGCGGISSRWLVSHGGFVLLVRRVQEHHGALGASTAGHLLTRVDIVIKISRGLGAYLPRRGVLV